MPCISVPLHPSKLTPALLSHAVVMATPSEKEWEVSNLPKVRALFRAKWRCLNKTLPVMEEKARQLGIGKIALGRELGMCLLLFNSLPAH